MTQPKTATNGSRPVLALVLAVGAAIAFAGLEPSAAAAGDACSGHIKPICELDQVAVCHCTRRKDSGETFCAWACEAKP